MPDIREQLLSRARTIPAKINRSAFSVAALTRRITGLFYNKSRQQDVERRAALKGPKIPESEIAALIRCSGEALEHIAFKEFATIVSNECKNTIGAAYGYVVVREIEEDEGEFIYRDQPIEEYVLDFSLSLPIQRLMARMYKSCDVVAENNLASLGAAEGICALGSLPVVNALFIPLVFHGETVGFMAFVNKPGGFTEDDRQVGNAFGKIASIVLHSERIMEELKANEQKFRAVAESSQNAFLTLNGAGRVVFWNESAEHIFGYKKEEVLGGSFFIGLKDGLPIVSSDPVEMTGARKNGKEFPMEVSSSSWNVGRERYYTSIITDISKRKESERKLREYAQKMREGKARDDALLLSIADGILVTDTEGKIIFANKTVEKLCGMSQKKILGQDLDETIPLFDDTGRKVPRARRPTHIALHPERRRASGANRSAYAARHPERRRAAAVSVFDTFYLIRSKDKKKIPLSISATPFIIDGEVAGSVAVWRDITREKEVDKAKDEFISFASHQLRTPLTSVSLAVDLLLGRINETSAREYKKYLQIASDGIKDMTDLIETLLNISRIQMGTLIVDPEPVCLAEFSDKILQDIAISTRSRKITVKRAYDEKLPVIKIDKRLMKIVLENLISNAVKYSPPRGSILIEVKKQAKNALISISNMGESIPEDHQEKIFEKLFRVQTDSKVKGTGLGLYMVKVAVEQYGGRVWCESPSARAFDSSKQPAEGKGATFFVTIPLAGMTAGKKAGE